MLGQVDVITSTLGKAMGGATGGFITGRREIIEILRQKSRPYLFSNTVAPVIVAAGIAAFDLLAQGQELREKLWDNTRFFRGAMKQLGFDIIDGIHPIVPVMFRKFENDAQLAQQMARELYEEGHLRRRLRLPRRAQGPVAHPRPDLRRPHPGTAGAGHPGLRESRPQSRSDLGDRAQDPSPPGLR